MNSGAVQTLRATTPLFSNDPDALTRAHEEIRAGLRDERGLTLNPKRGRVLPTPQPFAALGYRISRGGLTLGRAARRRMRARLQRAAARGGGGAGAVAALVSFDRGIWLKESFAKFRKVVPLCETLQKCES